MINKTRKHIWPGGLLMAIAIMGVLAVVVVLANNPGAAVAHEDADHETACANMTDDERRAHNVDENLLALQENRAPNLCMDPSATPPTPTPTTPPPAEGGAPDSYVIEGPGFVDQQANQVSDYVLVVKDEDGNNPDYATHGRNMVRVRFSRHDAVPSIDEAGDIVVGCLPDDARLVDVGLQGALTASLQGGTAATLCSITLDLEAGNDSFSIHATTVPNNTRLGISLTVIADDAGTSLVDTHTVTFLNPGVAPVAPPPVVGPVAGRGDYYSVVSYNDWAYMDVTDGYIVTDVNGVVQLVNDHPHQITGWMDRDEPVVAQYRLGLDARENLTQRTNPEMGQRTVEVLVTASDVQLTVTSTEEGPAYIRFLDSDMQPFGTDVDEEIEYRGADVVGLDSQGRLEMTEKTVNLSAAKALAYDQYSYTVPGVVTENAYLDGLAGDYYQGTFRFFDPCPGNVQGDHFYVQVYEKSGKYWQTTERITCIYPPGVSPSKLSVTTYTDREGDATLQWVEAIGAVAHHVIVIEQLTGSVVPGSYQRIASPVYRAEITGLSSNVPYIFAVAAERVDGSGNVSYSDPSDPDSNITQEMSW